MDNSMVHSLAHHIQQSLEPVAFVVQSYLADLTDDELFVRPAPGMNHIAWQLGHLIVSEHDHINAVTDCAMPALSDSFRSRHSRDNVAIDDAAEFCGKVEYLALMTEQRAGTLRLLSEMTDEQLQQPSSESLRYLGATVGCVFASQSLHWMMHAGQWAVVRRQLGRPPLF